ncbi:ComEC/Rec2 family competence protein [Flavobacterium capsici]|uniref:ComEC/Rec2 family competence protein n=1 Tax=Flavobacterium capsici TaxID=3075618 RepID=A0AA96EZJ7_9FLAO|nr:MULTISPECIES: ComEC/Rec2 family competence protein [unclassified Flavobacterium]WNM19980.1 ComEC/Rec2 family competence protein [Flavobacterium sp. PMR2A8]WNM21369.1 ComEC/Rec2 family competence protein [Flavobacterium sp. PMTSA4]
MKILQFPLTKISIGFVLGILLFPFIKTNPTTSLMLVSIGLFLLLIVHFFKTRKPFLNYFLGFIILINSFLFGITSASIHKQTFYSNHYSNHLDDFENNFEGTILLTEKIKSTQKNYRYIANLKTVENKEIVGKIIFNISKKETQISLPIGSILKIKATYYKNKNPFNPNQFDYGKYLEHQEIYGQLYSKTTDFKIVGSEKTFRSYFSNYRENLIDNLNKTSLSKDSFSIIVALLLGQKQDISVELMKEYQYAGAVHILAVSGLHVGIIMIFLMFLLKPIPNSKKGKLIKVIIILICLWSFALLAGLSPSVVRSVTMFSFLTIGTNLRRTVNIYHTLLISMLMILLVNPSFIYDVGFQLSYLAVFFILWLQPMLKSIWTPKNKILTYFWDIFTVSTAAQIGVMPLSIYYFHQFPGLFFLTNLLILPLLSIVMAVGIIVLIFSNIGQIPNFLIQLLDYLIQLMNQFIHWIASFDYLIFKNISFSKEMLWLSYSVILCIILYLLKSNFKRLSFALISIALLQLTFIFQKNQVSNSSEGIIFNQKKNSLISQRIGNKVILFANDSIQEHINENVTFQSYLVENFCKLSDKRNIDNFLYINNKKIIVIDSSGTYNPKINPDILIITQSPKLNLERLLKTLKPKIVITDGSNFKTYSKLWESTCRKQKIPFQNTHEKGFYKF